MFSQAIFLLRVRVMALNSGESLQNKRLKNKHKNINKRQQTSPKLHLNMRYQKLTSDNAPLTEVPDHRVEVPEVLGYRELVGVHVVAVPYPVHNP